MKILILNGPNLDQLGTRETSLYGEDSLEQIKNLTAKHSSFCQLTWYESSYEGDLIEKIHQLKDQDYSGLVINPGGLSHYSISLLDAMRSCSLPIIEVHLSQIFQREDLRHRPITARGAQGFIAGSGKWSYILAVDLLTKMLETSHVPNN